MALVNYSDESDDESTLKRKATGPAADAPPPKRRKTKKQGALKIGEEVTWQFKGREESGTVATVLSGRMYAIKTAQGKLVRKHRADVETPDDTSLKEEEAQRKIVEMASQPLEGPSLPTASPATDAGGLNFTAGLPKHARKEVARLEKLLQKAAGSRDFKEAQELKEQQEAIMSRFKSVADKADAKPGPDTQPKEADSADQAGPGGWSKPQNLVDSDVRSAVSINKKKTKRKPKVKSSSSSDEEEDAEEDEEDTSSSDEGFNALKRRRQSKRSKGRFRQSDFVQKAPEEKAKPEDMMKLDKSAERKIRGNAYIRQVTLTDVMSKGICKDYKLTGFCSFGDACVYLHDRGGYFGTKDAEKDDAVEDWRHFQKRAKIMGRVRQKNAKHLMDRVHIGTQRKLKNNYG